MTPTTTAAPLPSLESALGQPNYQLRVTYRGASDLHMEVWQLPAVATPHLVKPLRLGGLGGRHLALIEERVLRQLARSRVKLGKLLPHEPQVYSLTEEVALRLGLIFRVLAPMRSRDKMMACVIGIEEMGREEAAYWLGMALHRPNPRRVLAALRLLLHE